MENIQQKPLIKALILDWAGTTIDYGSLAPVRVFMQVFSHFGINITEEEARGPMGKAKRAHIADVLNLPRITGLWTSIKGYKPTDGNVQEIYENFLPLQKKILAASSKVIPGIPEAINWCRTNGLKIGSTTGYTRELMDVVIPEAAKGGYSPEVVVCSDEVSEGRPKPWLNFRAAELLGIYPMKQILVVDDTPLGILAGKDAGCPTVAVSKTGNALGLSQDDVNNLDPIDLEGRLAKISRDFLESGADYIVESVADLPGLIQDQFCLKL